MTSVAQSDETIQVHGAMWFEEGKKKVFFRRRRLNQKGLYVAPRSSLVPGHVTRREWLRFLTKVCIGEMCTCGAVPPHRQWLWTDRHSIWGYGHFLWRGRKYPAHSFACIALGRRILPGHEPDHLCRLGACVNPVCIDIVTPRENKLRGEGCSAVNARKTHCPQGHPLIGDNLDAYTLSQGGRRCKACKNAHDRGRYRKNGRKEVA
jgi:hypothetical protein